MSRLICAIVVGIWQKLIFSWRASVNQISPPEKWVWNQWSTKSKLRLYALVLGNASSLRIRNWHFEAWFYLPPILSILYVEAWFYLPPNLSILYVEAWFCLPPNLSILYVEAWFYLPPNLSILYFEAWFYLPPNLSILYVEAWFYLPPNLSILYSPIICNYSLSLPPPSPPPPTGKTGEGDFSSIKALLKALHCRDLLIVITLSL